MRQKKGYLQWYYTTEREKSQVAKQEYKSRVYTDRPAYADRAKYNTYKAERMAAEKKKDDRQEYLQEVLK